MAFSNIDQLDLGSLLQIVFTNEIYNQLSQDFRDLEYVKKATVKSSLAREIRFTLQTGHGPAAVQYRNPGTSGRAFPTAWQSSVGEKTAKFKEINATIELEYNLWSRAQKSPEKYGEPLALETASKSLAAKRRIACDFYGDGTGVVGTVASAAVTSPTSSNLTFTLSTSDTARGHAGAFELDDVLILKAEDNTTSALNTSLGTEPAYWQVVSKDRENGTVELKGLDSSFDAVATISSVSTGPTAGDVFYRYDQPTRVDLSSAISDYGTITEVLAGLESLVAADGRVVHGITMSGSTAGSRQSCGGNAIDVSYIHKAMDKAKLAVGQGTYAWKMMTMAPETLRALIESREADRRFNAMQDNKRGTTAFYYQHLQDSLEAVTSEFIPQKRIYILPEAKNGKKVIEFRGTEFETVKAPGGSDFHLKATSNGYVNSVQSFLQAIGVLIATHPAAVATVHNFSNS